MDALYNSAPASGPDQPALTSEPGNFTLTIGFVPAGPNACGVTHQDAAQVAIDASGNVVLLSNLASVIGTPLAFFSLENFENFIVFALCLRRILISHPGET